MANGLLSFIGGMAGGYINQTRRNEDMARQDRLDDMRAEEFELRKRQLEGQLGDQERERSDALALRESAAAPEPVKTWSQDAAGKTPEELQAMAEQMSFGEGGQDGEVAGQAGYTVGEGVKAKSFLQTPAGLALAKKEAQERDTDEARMGRYVNTLKAQGKVDEAMKYQASAEALKEKLNTARIAAVTNTGLGFIQEGNYAGLTEAYNQHYKDGRTAVFEPGVGDSGAIAIYQGNPADGKRLGAMSFKNKDDAARQFVGVMNPAEAFKSREAATQRAQEEARKLQKLAPGEQVYANGTKLYENTNQSSAERAALIRAGGQGGAGGAGGAGSGKSTKPELTGKEKALAAVEDKFKNELDPSALTRVRNYVSSSYDLDPSIDNNQRVLAAEEATTDPASTSPRLVFGAQGGIAATHINAATGAKTPLHRMSPQYTPTAEDKMGFKSDVLSFVENENRLNPGFGDLMYRAARGDKTAATALPEFVAGRIKQGLLAKNPLPANMTAAQKIKAMAELDARIKQSIPSLMADVNQSLALIKTYGLQ